MGLDMYLYGRKTDYGYIRADFAGKEFPKQDGFLVAYVELFLGYWRKHSDLHGYIVEEFADGVDECQRIEIDEDGLVKLIEAVKAHKLPQTSGFFFGRSARAGDGNAEELAAQDAKDLAILEKALAWLRDADKANDFRSIIYQASW